MVYARLILAIIFFHLKIEPYIPILNGVEMPKHLTT